MKKRVLLVVLMSAALSGLWGAAKPQQTIGFVTDGTVQESETMLSFFIQELKTLEMGNATLRFPASKQYHGAWSIENVKRDFSRLQNDPEVDMIVALGVISGETARQQAGNLKKPVFAPYLYVLNSSASPKSPMFNYLTANLDIDAMLDDFLAVSRFERAALLVDEAHYRLFPGAVDAFFAKAKAKGIRISLVVQASLEEDIISKIPADAQAVIIAPLPRLGAGERKALTAGLQKRKVPGFSLDEGVSAEEGALVSYRGLSDFSKRARQTALNLYDLLKGRTADTLPTAFDGEMQLVINMETARRIGVYPSFAVLKRAVVIGEEQGGMRLDLASVAREAVAANLNIIAGKLGVEAGSETVSEVRSVLFPQLSATLSYARMDEENPYVKLGSYAEKSTAGTLKLQQILFSEKALAYLAIQKEQQAAIEAQQRLLENEVVKQAATIYLGLLMAQSREAVETENLKLTRTNLKLANNRVRTGVSDRSDIYYWESQIALVEQKLIAARAEVDKASDLLNRVLHRPIDERFAKADERAEDPVMGAVRQTVASLIENGRDFERMAAFFIREGLRLSPELATLEARHAAVSRQLRSEKRTYWVPDLVMSAEVSRVFDETRSPLTGISMEDENYWQVGVALTLPLFEGGARGARIARSKLQLKQLESYTAEGKNGLEQAIRSDLHALKASYRSIEMADRAAKAAKKGMDLVRDNYAEGTRSVSDLLIAQNNSIAADHAAAVSVYRFLADLVQLQRDVGSYDLFLDAGKRGRLFERLQSYVAQSDDRRTKE